MTLTQRFYKLCLDPDILHLSILNRADIRNDPVDNSTRQFRKAVYRQFILDKYGYLGRGNRKVVPFCAVWKVRCQYPSPTGVYMGFRDSSVIITLLENRPFSKMAAENLNKSQLKTNTSTRKSTLNLVTPSSFSISGEISPEKM